MKKTFIGFIAVLVAIAAFAETYTISMGDTGTSYSITNGAGTRQFKTVLIQYLAASTNTVTLSKITGTGTFVIGTEASTNAAATTDVWENDYTIPFEAGDIFKVASTDTNCVIEIITE
jgi:hypothetical protein